MPGSGLILDYAGQVDNKTIDRLLKKLKGTRDFKDLDKTTGKRLYTIMVECLENIARHSVNTSSVNQGLQPFISAEKQNDNIIIKSGNPIPGNKAKKLTLRLTEVNQIEENALHSFYEILINNQVKKDNNGAGFGFILIRLKSGNKIDFGITGIDDDFSFFKMQISINKYTMRKLIIEETASSPRVILDPEKKIYQISGESRPPDVREFYDQIISWLDDFSLHIQKPDSIKDPVIFSFKFEYFNSSSAKLILDICKILAGLRLKGINIIVKWHFEKEDADMLEVGREMSRIVKFPFEFVEIGMN